MLSTDEDLQLSIAPTYEPPNVLSVTRDYDSSLRPSTWIWLMFDDDWRKLTLTEAAWLRDRLNTLLGE